MEYNFSGQRLDASKLPPAVLTKWSGEVLREGFVPFPKRLLRCLPKVLAVSEPLHALAVVLAIVDFQRPDLTREPSLEFLAFVSGLPIEKFSALLDELVERGLIERHEGAEGVVVRYHGLQQAILSATKDS